MKYGKFSVGRRISYRNCLRWEKSLSYVSLHKQLTYSIENVESKPLPPSPPPPPSTTCSSSYYYENPVCQLLSYFHCIEMLEIVYSFYIAYRNESSFRIAHTISYIQLHSSTVSHIVNECNHIAKWHKCITIARKSQNICNRKCIVICYIAQHLEYSIGECSRYSNRIF